MKLTESKLRSLIREELQQLVEQDGPVVTPSYMEDVADELRDMSPIRNVDVSFDRRNQKIKFNLQGVREKFSVKIQEKTGDEVRVEINGPLWSNQNAYFGREFDVKQYPLKVAREIFRNVADYE